MNSRFIKILLIIIGFFYLVVMISKHRNNDSFFYIGLAAVALYTVFAYKKVEVMDEEQDEK